MNNTKYAVRPEQELKIAHKLPYPTNCHCCGSKEIDLVSNRVIYRQEEGKWPFVWYCYNCAAAVSCHPYTRRPVGFMATRSTRALRRRVHRAFDPLWKGIGGNMSRSDAYAWLAKKMNLAVELCHVSYFDMEMCQKALRILELHRRGKLS